MGRGNICVFQDYEKLVYIDKDYLHEYRLLNGENEDDSYRLQSELSFEELTGGDWVFDEFLSQRNWEDAKLNLIYDMMARFPSLTRCDKWVGYGRDRHALLENKLFYIAVADNEWSQAVMLLRKEDDYTDFSGLQKRHYRHYMDAILDSLFQQFKSLCAYSCAWTSRTVSSKQEFWA